MDFDNNGTSISYFGENLKQFIEIFPGNNALFAAVLNF